MHVVIPTFNKKELLIRTLTSIQKWMDYTETIIVVNNEENNEYTKVKNNYKRYKFFFLNDNYGFAKAVNHGISMCNSNLITLFNDDIELTNCINVKKVAQIFENDPKIFSISLKMIQYASPELIDDAGDMYTILGWQFKRGNGLPKELYDRPCEIISSCGGAAIYNKKILDEIGYFDEDFFAYLEDVDLGLRALMRGYKNLYYPYISVLHVGSATTGGKYNDITIRLTARNSIYVIYKNLPLPLLIINFPFILLGYLIKFMFFTKKGKGRIYISGVLEGLKNLPKFKEKRKENMRKKKISNIKLEWILIKATFEYFHQYIKRTLYNLRGAKK